MRWWFNKRADKVNRKCSHDWYWDREESRYSRLFTKTCLKCCRRENWIADCKDPDYLSISADGSTIRNKFALLNPITWVEKDGDDGVDARAMLYTQIKEAYTKMDKQC